MLFPHQNLHFFEFVDNVAILKIVVDIVAENVNLDSADLAFSASTSACMANSTLSATISASFNILWVLRQILLIVIDIVANNVTHELDGRNWCGY